ncbi:lysylphosphatidylglycerol synthase transmembrane domain-containing protein [Actinomadura opuntiae]|uniref:lysylphosphatidylglycerol synthase transmembrane domain-containing protein n=1 Tax=Actinomadura sp. OS1-43 TaxID=604315 RepID=UPI00255A8056|nr:lysylphosphatidylglycerol synthase domain-containing protein [Actinomadura sp. OS1-43]MDL4820801.1 lysylphosphatidylglycerol synthase domain-containing protein [Actinomadura sp. OS1-43]
MESIAAGARRGPSADALALRRTRRTILVVSLIVLAAAAFALLRPVPLRPLATAVAHVRWEFLPVLLMLALLHYVCAAVALRSASGRRLPLARTTLAQFAAAAANRVTLGGLGAAAVNTRYLVRHGVPLPRAAVGVAVLHVSGTPTDLLLVAAVLALGDGDERMMDALAGHAVRVLDLVTSLPLLLLAGAMVPVAVVWGRRAVRSAAMRRAAEGFTDLCRRPRDLAVMLTASAATTFVLGIAFTVSALAVPGTGAAPGDAVALVTAYLLGAFAGAAVPAPGGIGSTEAALVATLTALGVPGGPALQTVLVFRATTFWAPVPVGLLACRTLCR